MGIVLVNRAHSLPDFLVHAGLLDILPTLLTNGVDTMEVLLEVSESELKDELRLNLGQRKKLAIALRRTGPALHAGCPHALGQPHNAHQSDDFPTHVHRHDNTTDSLPASRTQEIIYQNDECSSRLRAGADGVAESAARGEHTDEQHGAAPHQSDDSITHGLPRDNTADTPPASRTQETFYQNDECSSRLRAGADGVVESATREELSDVHATLGPNDSTSRDSDSGTPPEVPRLCNSARLSNTARRHRQRARVLAAARAPPAPPPPPLSVQDEWLEAINGLRRKFGDAEARHLFDLSLLPLLIANDMLTWVLLSLRLAYPPHTGAFRLADAFGRLSAHSLFADEPLEEDEFEGLMDDFLGEPRLGLVRSGSGMRWLPLERGIAHGTWSYAPSEQCPRVDISGILRARTKVDITATIAARIAGTIGASDGIYRAAADDEASDDPSGGDENVDGGWDDGGSDDDGGWDDGGSDDDGWGGDGDGWSGDAEDD
jgi:hypothetical protein